MKTSMFGGLAAMVLVGALQGCGVQDVPAALGSRSQGGRTADDTAHADDSTSARGQTESGGGFTRGSTAWFAHEAVETSLRLAILGDATIADRIVGTNAALNAQAATVTLSLSDLTSRTYNCQMVDDVSHGGTVTKKDVRCAAG